MLLKIESSHFHLVNKLFRGLGVTQRAATVAHAKKFRDIIDDVQRFV